MDPHGPYREFGIVPPEVAGGMTGLEFLQKLLTAELPAPPFARTAQIWPVSVARGHVVFAGQPSAQFYNPMGFVHGGWISMLLDTVMGCAVHSALGARQGYTTIDLHTTFSRPLREDSGTLRAEGTLLHVGGRIASAEGKLFDSDGQLIAHGTETCCVMAMGR